MDIRDRIVEFKRMSAAEINDNTKNWRTHEDDQKDVMAGILRSIGIADALIAYYSQRNGGALTLINGHLRKDLTGDAVWPVLITDLNDEEADLLLAVFDTVTGMAGVDSEKAMQLAEDAITGEWAVRELVHKLAVEAASVEREVLKEEKKRSEGGPEDMELLPFEHYDYVLMMFKNELDWQGAIETLGLKRQSDPRKTGRVGLARVMLFPSATVCIDEREADNYAPVVPAEQILLHPPLRSLGEIRNWIMDHVEDDTIFMPDDDIEMVLSFVGLTAKRYKRPEDVLQIIENAAECARGIGAMLFGFNQSAKAYIFSPHDPLDFNNWVGSAIGIVSKDLRWDDRLSLHPDIDFSLQNLLERRIIFRDNRFHFLSAKRLRSLGGNSTARSGEREEREMALIKARWGKYIENIQAGSKLGKSSETSAKRFYVKRRQK